MAKGNATLGQAMELQRIRWTPIFLSLVTAGLAIRLLALIDAHAVDLLYYDQLDFYEAFKGDPDIWRVFRWQHGPHRQGLPFLGTWLLASWTDWNIRADAFYVGGLVLLATGLALWLRRRLLGPFHATDIAIPLLLLTPAQYGIFIHTPNASHAAGPLALLMLFCLAQTLEERRARYGTLVALDFVMIHTGFAIFAGALTPTLLAISALRDGRREGLRAARLPLAGLALSLLWVGVFLIGYTQRGGLSKIQGTERLELYPRYVAYMFSNVLGLKGPGPLSVYVGMAVALLTLGIAVWSLQALVRPRTRPTPALSVIFTLTTFSLLYCVTTAVGRVHLGLSGAQSTRYVPLVAPALLGTFFALVHGSRHIEHPTLRHAAPALAALGLIAATFPMRAAEARFMEKLSTGKRIWVETYRETGDLRASNEAARIRLYPRVGDPKDGVEEKLDYLRAEKLSFFAER